MKFRFAVTRRLAAASSLLCLATALLSQPAFADDWGDCGSKSLPPNTVIAACTRSLASAETPHSALALIYSQRGAAYYALGDLDWTIADFTAAIQIDPSNPVQFVDRGTAYDARGNYPNAISDFAAAVRLDPNDEDAFFSLGISYAKMGDRVHAVAYLTEAIRLKPNDADAYLSRGTAYYNNGIYAQAISDLTMSIAIRPDAATFNSRGIVYRAAGNIAASLADFSQAASLSAGK